MRTFISMRQLCPALVLVAACGALASSGPRPVNRSRRSPSRAEQIVAGLEATSARQVRLVRSFTTNKTFTVTHGGQTNARVVAALNFTAPDVKVFTVLESRGSDFVRTQVIDRMMAAEIEVAPVNGVWVQGRTLARVTIRWLGEYNLQSECGPYRMLLAVEAPTRLF